MAYKVSMKPVVKSFPLPLDETEQSFITIKQATTGDLVRLGNVFSKQQQIWRDGEVGTVRLEKDWNPEELKRERAYCTLVGADLVWEDEKGQEVAVFKFKDGKNGLQLDMTRTDFIKAWDALDPQMTDVIYEFVLEANPSEILPLRGNR